MQSSESSGSTNKDKPTEKKVAEVAPSSASESATPQRSCWLIMLVWLLRLIFGAVLILSGFVKGVDPWGGLYKITEYFAAWNLSITHEGALLLASLLATFEFVLGVVVAAGLYRKSSPVLSVAFMAIMTTVTLYILIADPVADCGCFGDAIKLSNTATFLKNIVLLALAILLLKVNKSAEPLIRPRLQWIALVMTSFYIIAVQIFSYHVQPLIDFRPYPVGTDMSEKATEVAEAQDNAAVFVYERDGKQQTFNIDNLPDEDDGWNFVERRSENVETPEMLSVLDEDGEDVTAEIFEKEMAEGNPITDGHDISSLTSDDMYILVVNDPVRYGISRSESANRLYDYCRSRGSEMLAIVAVSPDSIAQWRNMTGAQYPVYASDDTDLKMFARGDAAIVALRNGVIEWKSNIYALPPEFPDLSDSSDIIQFQTLEPPLGLFTIVWLAAMLVLYIISRFIRHLPVANRVSDDKTNEQPANDEQPA